MRLKAKLLFLSAIGFLFIISGPAYALNLYVDSAPNVYGSSEWDPWWNDAKKDVDSGNFTNLRTGTFPGTTTIHPEDMIVYSYGNLGKRLHWIYWMPETSIDKLSNNFQVKYVVDWAGADLTIDWDNNAWTENDGNSGWTEPSSWENYNDGVIGSFGHAWWAKPDDEEGLEDKIDELTNIIFANQSFATGMVRFRDGETNDWQITSLETNVVPEPTTWLLFGTGLLGLLAVGRKKIFNRGLA